VKAVPRVGGLGIVAGICGSAALLMGKPGELRTDVLMQLACMNPIEDLAGRPCCRGGMQPRRITKRMPAPG